MSHFFGVNSGPPQARSHNGILSLRRDSQTPPICIKCGAPCSSRPITRTLYWHEQWVYLLVLAGVLIYAVVALCIRKTGKISFYLCDDHKKSRATKMLIGWLTCLGLIGLAILGIVLEIGPLIAIGFLGAFVAMIVFIIINQTLKLSSIDAYYVNLRGVPMHAMDAITKGAGVYSNAFPVEVSNQQRR